MNIRGCMIGLSAVCVLFAEQGETKLSFSNLPSAVQKTAKQESEGATVRGYSKEVEHGETLYEVELSINGKTKDLSLDAAGNVVEVEQEVEFNSLPAATKAALTKRAAGSKIQKVEKVSKGQDVSYEAVVLSGGKRKEITARP